MAAKATRGEDGDPDEGIAEIGPEQRGDEDCDGDQQAAHGRRAGFFLMGLRAFFADVLADLKVAQALNYDRADDESGEKRGEAGEGGAEREIAEDAERRKVMVELQIEQPVEQTSPVVRQFVVRRFSFAVRRSRVLEIGACSFQTSRAFSSFTPREAFSRTASPSRVSPASHSPASSGETTNSAFIPASRAASTIGFAKPARPAGNRLLVRHVTSTLAMELLGRHA